MSRTGATPGRRTVAAGFLAAYAAVAVDLALGGRLSLFYDLCFVVICVGLGLLVRVPDVVSVGVLPPLIMLASFLPLATIAPATLAHPRDGFVQAVVTGFAWHSTALMVGYALCLGALVARHRSRGREAAGSGLASASR